jgi:hypothetical protein
MNWQHAIAFFFGGVFLTNALPHFVSGLMGRPFQTPFAKPPGKGLSSSTVNVVWGFLNLVIFYALVCHPGNFDIGNTAHAAALGLGMLVMAIVTARLFGRFHGGNAPPVS